MAHFAPESRQPLIVVEDDPFPRILQVVLDPTVTRERTDAFIDFFAHTADFPAWCDSVRAAVGTLYPSTVVTVKTQEELRAKLPGCCSSRTSPSPRTLPPSRAPTH